MSKENFEDTIGELLKGTVNIENVNLHFGDCNNATYMGGAVAGPCGEYGSEACGDCDCGCCPGDFPVVDSEEAAKWVQKKTGVDLDTVRKVLEAEEDYLEEIGVSVQLDFDSGTEGEQVGKPEKKAASAKDVKPAKDDQPQWTKPEQDGKPNEKTLDEMLGKALDDIMPRLLCMGLMGAVFDDIFNPSKTDRKEPKDGKDE